MTTTTRACSSKETMTAAFLLLLFLSSTVVSLAARAAGSSKESVYVVLVKRPAEGVNYEAYHIRILATVVGSKEKAKQALVYSYKLAASGFAAKLTPAQLAALQKHPDVIQVMPDQKYTLHDNKLLD